MKLTWPLSWALAWRSLRASRPYLASLVFHAGGLVILSLILLPIAEKFQTHFLVSRFDPDELAEQLETVTPAAVLGGEQTPDFATAWNDSESPAETLPINVAGLTSPGSIVLEQPEPADPRAEAVEPSPETVVTEIDERWGTAPHAPSGTSEVREAENPGGALSPVTIAIKQELEQGHTLVVWLADASISLAADRALMAQHMVSFYESLGAYDVNDQRDGTRLMNAVMAFGSGAREVLAPNRFGKKACAKLADIPVDNSGVENVMSAVQRALGRYRRGVRFGERMMIVIITDESGDDTVQLESTIELCRESHVPVHVIGPSAVFGAQWGSHAWKNPATGHEYMLPVLRGPDTALPQRAWLPYWHESLVPPWRQNLVQIASATSWYGGPYRERLVSGFGPYALTRLALQTGGSFTVLDREGDRSRFRLEDLRDYLPHYGSLAEYNQSLAGRPLRLAVSHVAVATLEPRLANALTPPRMSFVGARHHFYPFKSYNVYVEPSAFAQRLAADLKIEERVTAGKQELLMALAGVFNEPDIDWEREYADEKSARWRASYDLTKGRLLASIVRCLEYRNACLELPSRVPPGANHVVLHDATDLAVPLSRELAAEATRLLKRCVELNPGTPWGQLAEWELDKGLGMRFTSRVLSRPRPRRVPATTIPTFPKL